MIKTYETDWLASKPVFYNEVTNKVSYNINDVIDFTNIEFHPEGFINYLDFGYSVFEQTPVKHVKFMRHSSRLTVNDKGQINLEYLDDPVEKWVGKTSHEDDVWNLFEKLMNDWEEKVDGEIIIPTSGGYDSRLLNYFIKDKSRIRSFSYGISEKQSESFEVLYAKRLSEILGTNWEQIELGDFHHYFDDWDLLYGISTHAHGMYHIEFYQKIYCLLGGGFPLLSGLNIDSWSGTRIQNELENQNINNLNILNLPILGLTHGMHADSKRSNLKSNFNLRSEFINNHSYELRDDRWLSIWKTRLRSILMSYLLIIPTQFAYSPYAPGNDISLAKELINIPIERRKGRIYQKEFFQNKNLELEAMGIKASRENVLNQIAMDRVPVNHLNVNLLSEFINTDYVNWINKMVQPRGAPIRRLIHVNRKLSKYYGSNYLGRFTKKILNNWHKERLSAYCAYLTLKPIEELLLKRDKAQGKLYE